MRIATSTLYEQQTAAIDDLNVQNADVGSQLSTGKQLAAPSDDPTQIAADLSVRTTIAKQTKIASNIQGSTAELTATDSALSTLTSVLQSARSIAVQGASDALTSAQKASLAGQVDQLLNQAVNVANTQYGGKHIFAGTATGTAPVVANGSPATSVRFLGNFESQGQIVSGASTLPLSTTLQQAFNYKASDGSTDVFAVLQNLRDSLTQGTSVDASATSINAARSVIAGPNSPSPSTLGNAPFATPLVADNGAPPSYSISINGTATSGVQNNVILTFTNTTPIDDGPADPTSVVNRINAQSALTGVTAAFDAKGQRLTLTGANGPFQVTDVPTPGTGATTAGGFTKSFGLVQQGDSVNNVSRQLGDIDKVINVTLDARGSVGAKINALSSINDQNSTSLTDNNKVQSGIEDVDVAKAIARLSQTQTALQAAYATTTRIESKSLINYV